jgi:hypothetical protein
LQLIRPVARQLKLALPATNQDVLRMPVFAAEL